MRPQEQPNPYQVSLKVKETLSPGLLTLITTQVGAVETRPLEGGGTEVICPNEELNCIKHIREDGLKEVLQGLGFTVLSETEAEA